jgi:hypothetical protein
MKIIIYTTLFLSSIFLTPTLANQLAPYEVVSCEKEMKNKDFKKQLEVIEETEFSDTKLQLCKGIIKNNCISIKQLKEFLGVFSFEKHKTEIAKEAYEKVVDKQNFYQIYSLFKQEINVQEIEEYIQSK